MTRTSFLKISLKIFCKMFQYRAPSFFKRQFMQRALRTFATIESSQSNEYRGLSCEALRNITLEDRHGAHNYHPLPVVLSKGAGMNNFP